MKINIVVKDVVNDVKYFRKSVNTCVVITLLLQDIIHWKTAVSYAKMHIYTLLDLLEAHDNTKLSSRKFALVSMGIVEKQSKCLTLCNTDIRPDLLYLQYYPDLLIETKTCPSNCQDMALNQLPWQLKL